MSDSEPLLQFGLPLHPGPSLDKTSEDAHTFSHTDDNQRSEGVSLWSALVLLRAAIAGSFKMISIYALALCSLHYVLCSLQQALSRSPRPSSSSSSSSSSLSLCTPSLLSCVSAFIMLFDDAYRWELGTLKLRVLCVCSAASFITSNFRFYLFEDGKSGIKATAVLSFVVLYLLSSDFLEPTTVEDPAAGLFDYNEYSAGSTPRSCDNGHTKPGLYASALHPFPNEVASIWEATKTTDYDADPRRSSWLFSGDARTLAPFALASPFSPPVEWRRRWVETTDGEAVAVDCVAREGRDIYLLLHGLNGGSNEGYVKDFAHSTREATVCVMIGRGMMATPILSGKMFNGARTSDVEVVAGVLKGILREGGKLIGVGYSMGAIVLSK